MKLAAISREIFDTEFRHSAVFLPSRQRLYDKVRQIVPADEKPQEEVKDVPAKGQVEEQVVEERAEAPAEKQPVEVIDVVEERIEDVKAAAAAAIAEAKKESRQPCCNNNQVHTGWRRLLLQRRF